MLNKCMHDSELYYFLHCLVFPLRLQAFFSYTIRGRILKNIVQKNEQTGNIFYLNFLMRIPLIPSDTFMLQIGQKEIIVVL